MKLSEFRFEVPKELIATQLIDPRSLSKLLVFNRRDASTQHSKFISLSDHLNKGDLLVFNETFVIPARFFGRRKTGAAIEGLLLQTPPGPAMVWIKGKANLGDVLVIEGFGDAQVVAREGRRVQLDCTRDALVAGLKAKGHIPIPPYILAERERRNDLVASEVDRANYQSIFARESAGGYSVAAPTASLHFDRALEARLRERGVESAFVQLHVGEGTFSPVEAEDLDGHIMHSEEVCVPTVTSEKIAEVKAKGGRVIAVGTTVCRALESSARGSRDAEPFRTNLFIRPPFEFRIVDGLITNFHWPDSTLIVLVATFLEADHERKCGSEIRHAWRDLYAAAVEQRYRFFSYGDGMLIL